MTSPPLQRRAGTGRGRRASVAPAVVLALAVLLAVLAPAAAQAHPNLVQNAPVAGQMAADEPNAIVLSFSEEINERGADIELRRLASSGRSTVIPATAKVKRLQRSGTRLDLSGRLKPGIYEVRWSVLGVDGHAVGGRYRFGVATPDGTPVPGAELIGATGAGDGSATAAGREGTGTIVARWLGLLSAALLLGGVALRARLGRLADGDERWTRVALLALLLGLISAVAGALFAANLADGGSLALLTESGNGRLALVRVVVAVVALLAVLRAGLGSRRGAELVLGGSAAVALVVMGLDGHVQALDEQQLLAIPSAVLHVLAAGVWSGGVLALLVHLLPRGDDRSRALPVADGVRAFTPLAGGALAVLAATGLIAALREVDRTVFLWYTGYGRFVIAKTLLLVVLAAFGTWLTLRARRGREEGEALPRLLRADAVGTAAILLLAASLASLVQGRGQPLPSQRGNLLGGPATASAVAGDAALRVSVAPGTPGRNTVSVLPTSLKAGVPLGGAPTVRLRGPGGDVPVKLRRSGSTWSGTADLSSGGTWFAYAGYDKTQGTAPVSLTIGDPARFGPDPVEVLQTADLSGPAAQRCRQNAQGLSLAVGRLNARGGVRNGRKVVLRTIDDGGVARRAAAVVRSSDAIALVSPCGPGAAGALGAAGDLPAIAADPTAPVVRGKRVWRLAPDPRAEGFAMARFVGDQRAKQRPDGPRVVSVLSADTAPGRERLAGIREGLAKAGLRARIVDPQALRSPAATARAIDARRVSAAIVDGDPDVLAPALSRSVADTPRFAAASIVVPSALFDESFVTRSGDLGRIGAIQAASEVTVVTNDALGYRTGAQALFRGDRPSIWGLRGFVAGLTLTEAIADGTATGDFERKLRRPRRFTDAIGIPWRADAPERGAPLVQFIRPQFLPARLVPVSAGGESFQGTWFADGSWQPIDQILYGPRLTGTGLGG